MARARIHTWKFNKRAGCAASALGQSGFPSQVPECEYVRAFRQQRGPTSYLQHFEVARTITRPIASEAAKLWGTLSNADGSEFSACVPAAIRHLDGAAWQ